MVTQGFFTLDHLTWHDTARYTVTRYGATRHRFHTIALHCGAVGDAARVGASRNSLLSVVCQV